jgi:hypothetical protein
MRPVDTVIDQAGRQMVSPSCRHINLFLWFNFWTNLLNGLKHLYYLLCLIFVYSVYVNKKPNLLLYVHWALGLWPFLTFYDFLFFLLPLYLILLLPSSSTPSPFSYSSPRFSSFHFNVLFFTIHFLLLFSVVLLHHLLLPLNRNLPFLLVSLDVILLLLQLHLPFFLFVVLPCRGHSSCGARSAAFTVRFGLWLNAHQTSTSPQIT